MVGNRGFTVQNGESRVKGLGFRSLGEGVETLGFGDFGFE
jgi:hypothetical protein